MNDSTKPGRIVLGWQAFTEWVGFTSDGVEVPLTLRPIPRGGDADVDIDIPPGVVRVRLRRVKEE